VDVVRQRLTVRPVCVWPELGQDVKWFIKKYDFRHQIGI
jgi:hypothetical protein